MVSMSNFGEDAENAMPAHYMLMMAQILNLSLAVAYDFAPYLVDVIHEGLIGINNAKVDRPFGRYSMLMHMFLFKGVEYFGKDMDLPRERDGEDMPVQLWSADMSWDREDASYLKFDRCFASKLRILLCQENPRIPKVLLEFIRLKEFAKSIKIVHNWGDIILYPISTIFRVYGFSGTQYFLPYQVPLKIGIAEIMRQIGGLQEVELTNKGRGTIFPTITMTHQFVVIKGGWLHFEKFLQPYRLSTIVARFADLEDFLNGMFRKKVRCSHKIHQFHFPEDLIRNEFNLDQQEGKKEKWLAYKKTLDFVQFFDKNYDPLKSFHPFEERINYLIGYFEGAMQTLNEKKAALMKAGPEKAKLVFTKPLLAKVIPPGEYVMYKKSGYNVVMPRMDEPSMSKGKRPMEDALQSQASPKRQGLEKEA